MSKPLLILDLDETLIRGEKAPLARPPDFVVRDKYFMYIRPGAEKFIQEMARHYAIAFWSSSSRRYVGELLEGLLPTGFQPEFAWSVQECRQMLGAQGEFVHYVKDLDRVFDRGFSLARTLILDNTQRKIMGHLDNHVPISSYFAAPDDRVLAAAAAYLTSIADAPDFRLLDKSKWQLT